MWLWSIAVIANREQTAQLLHTTQHAWGVKTKPLHGHAHLAQQDMWPLVCLQQGVRLARAKGSALPAVNRADE
jgi:hypothetical protein